MIGRRRAVSGPKAGVALLAALALPVALLVLPVSAETESAPMYSESDLRFLQRMIVHHEQALVMSALVPERSDRGEFARFARYVARAQAAEIDLMQSLLDLAADRGLAMPDPRLEGDPPMDGMLSSARISALEEASGARFERLWMTGMIEHHEGAVTMARAQQRRQLESGRRPYGLHVLVEDILVEQRAEISQMEAWLREWGLTGRGE